MDEKASRARALATITAGSERRLRKVAADIKKLAETLNGGVSGSAAEETLRLTLSDLAWETERNVELVIEGHSALREQLQAEVASALATADARLRQRGADAEQRLRPDIELAQLNLTEEEEDEASLRRMMGFRIIPRPLEILWMDDHHLDYSAWVDAALPIGIRVTWARNLREARFHLHAGIDGIVVDLHLSQADVDTSRATGLHLFELVKDEGLRIPIAICSLDIITAHRKAAMDLGAIRVFKLNPMLGNEQRVEFLTQTFGSVREHERRKGLTPEDREDLQRLQDAWARARPSVEAPRRDDIDRRLSTAVDQAAAEDASRDAVCAPLERLFTELGPDRADLSLLGLRSALLPLISNSRGFDPGAFMDAADLDAPGVAAERSSGEEPRWYDRDAPVVSRPIRGIHSKSMLANRRRW